LSQEEGIRSLEENYDGEFSSFYGRSQAGTGEFFGDLVEKRASRREAIKTGLVLTAAAVSGGAVAVVAGDAEAAGLASATGSVATQAIQNQAGRGLTGLTFQGIHLERGAALE